MREEKTAEETLMPDAAEPSPGADSAISSPAIPLDSAANSSQSWSEHIGKRAPNWLTLLRILLVPVFVMLLSDPSSSSSIWATGIFVFASLTDWLDGYIARLYNAESILGTLLDPLADKVLVMSALVMLCSISPEPRVPAWMVVLLLGREMLVTGLRSVAAFQGTIVAASRTAKYKTAVQMFAIFCLLLWEPYMFFGFTIDFSRVGNVAIWIALVLSLASGAQYARALRRMFI